MTEARRERKAITAGVERELLTALAARMPPWVTSDRLTVLGVMGALGAGAGYALSAWSPHWLWLASGALVINWFGDSLDGTLARVRRTERPRYGYYLDHAVDAFTTVAIGVGIGLSPYVPLPVALALVVLYLMMSINVYLESGIYGVFRMDYGVLGPTEVRMILVGANTLLVGFHLLGGPTPLGVAPVAALVMSAVVAGMAVMLVSRFVHTLRDLARLEPPPARARTGEVAAGDAVGADEDDQAVEAAGLAGGREPV
jgi:archaetidylinositol phosphate synthase